MVRASLRAGKVWEGALELLSGECPKKNDCEWCKLVENKGE